MTPTAKPRRFRGRLAIAGDGLYRRTILMLPAHARSFARCLDANPRVLSGSVSVRRSVRATQEANCYVLWQPFNPERASEIDGQFVADRRRRAVEELHEYAFWPTLDWPGWYWCIHDHGPGRDAGVYLVHPQLGCHPESGCKDMRYRCRRLHALCKHAEGLILHLQQTRESAEREERS